MRCFSEVRTDQMSFLFTLTWEPKTHKTYSSTNTDIQTYTCILYKTKDIFLVCKRGQRKNYVDAQAAHAFGCTCSHMQCPKTKIDPSLHNFFLDRWSSICSISNFCVSARVWEWVSVCVYKLYIKICTEKQHVDFCWPLLGATQEVVVRMYACGCVSLQVADIYTTLQ